MMLREPQEWWTVREVPTNLYLSHHTELTLQHTWLIVYKLHNKHVLNHKGGGAAKHLAPALCLQVDSDPH